MCQRHRQVRLAQKRHAASGHLVEHRAQAVHVGLRQRLSPANHLGRDVVDRAHDRAGARQAARSHRLGNAEIGQTRTPVLTKQHVLRLHVAVDEALAVGVVERGRQNGTDRADFAIGKRRRATDEVLQVAALDELHDDVGRTRFGVLADVIDRNDVWVAQTRRGASFTPEALEELGIIGVLWMEQLDRDASIQQGVVRLPDRGHATAGDLAEQLVATSEHALGAWQAHNRLTSSSASASRARSPWRLRISRSACAWTRLI